MSITSAKGPQVSLRVSARAGSGLPGRRALDRLLARVPGALGGLLGGRGWGRGRVEAALHLCGERRMASLNREWLGREGPTDVLAFPVHGSLRRRPPRPAPPLLHLGDVFLCGPVASRRAARRGVGLEREVSRLIAHGLLHLLGYDHERSPGEARAMARLEGRLAEGIHG